MSFGLYLLPLKLWHGVGSATKMLDRLNRLGFHESTRRIARVDARKAAELLRALEPRYEPFPFDYEKIAQSDKIPSLKLKPNTPMLS